MKVPSLLFLVLYDKLNRLTSGMSADNYKEKGITYDLMGNITALNRYQAGTQVDSLIYTYSGTNQLQSITDASGNNTGVKAGTGLAYAYDGNGNLTTDPSRNSGSINVAYNLLNLPQSITGGKTITYTYDADGNKLRRVSTGTGNTDYISGIEYDGTSTDTLNFIQTEEGRAVKQGSTYDYQYYLGDNLGNTRVTFGTKTGAAVLLQQDDYYPFGMEINRSVGSLKNEYLYNKKELQEELGQYDYGARFYDPVIGRWTTIDSLAQVSRRWSPYNYVENNPIRLTDPDGMSAEDDMLNDKSFEKASDLRVGIAKALSNSGNSEVNPENGNVSSEENGGDDQCCKTIGPPKKQPKPQKVFDKEPESKGEKTAKTVEQVGNIAGYTGVVLDATKDAAKAQKALKLAKIANVGGITTVLIGTFADAYLTTHVDPKTGKPYLSHAMAATNLGVTVVAIGVGGTGGIVVEVGYILVKANMNMEEKHPELLHDNPFRELHP